MSTQGGGKADTMVKVVLVFFISLLSFSVGTFVGKQVSDKDRRHAALESDAKGEREPASAHEGEGHGAQGDSEKISAKDVESLTDEFVAQEKLAGGHSEAKGHSDSGHSEEVASAEGFKSYKRAKKPAKGEGLEEVAQDVAKGEAPSDGMAEARKPASILPSVASGSVGKFTVQVASYPEEKEAKSHAADLKTQGWNAFYVPAMINGRTWYRVSVGLFNNDKTAQSFRAQFMKESGAKAAIVQKIVQ